MVKGGPIPLFTSLQPIFTSQQAILQFLEPGFVSKLANSKREKQLQNDTKGGRSPLQGI